MLQYHLQADLLYIYIYSHLDRYYMPYYGIVNLVTVTQMNIIDGIPCGYGSLITMAVRIQHQVSCSVAQRFLLLSKSQADLSRGLSGSKIDHPVGSILNVPL